MANEARSIRRAIAIGRKSCSAPPSRLIATSSTPGPADAAVRMRGRPALPAFDVCQRRPVRPSVTFARQQPGRGAPKVLANVWENGDVQEHSGSYSLRASGQAGD